MIPAAQNQSQNQAQDPSTISIFRAASDGNVTAVRNLLNAGADVNAREHEGETPLMYAAVAGKIEVVKLLLDRGADINAVSVNNETALARAVGVKQYDAVKLLLDRGVDIEKSISPDGPPLIYVAGNDDLKMVKLLFWSEALTLTAGTRTAILLCLRRQKEAFLSRRFATCSRLERIATSKPFEENVLTILPCVITIARSPRY